MRKAVNPGIEIKRKTCIIMFLISVMIGIQGQNSYYFMDFGDIKSYEKARAEFKNKDLIDIQVVYDSLLARTESDLEIYSSGVSHYIDLESENMISGSNFEYNLAEADIDVEMELEEWMLHEFNNTYKSDVSDDKVEEETMEIENWMLDTDSWITVNK